MFGRLRLSARSVEEERRNSERESASPQQPSSTTLSPRDSASGDSPGQAGDTSQMTSPYLDAMSTPEGHASRGTPASSARGRTPGSLMDDDDDGGSEGTPASMTSSVSGQPGTPMTGNDDSAFFPETPSTEDPNCKTRERSAADEESQGLDQQTSKDDSSNVNEKPEADIAESEPFENPKETPEKVSDGETSEKEEKSASVQDMKETSNIEQLSPENSNEASNLNERSLITKDLHTSETDDIKIADRGEENAQNVTASPEEAAPNKSTPHALRTESSVAIDQCTDRRLHSNQPPMLCQFGREPETSIRRRVRQREPATVAPPPSRFQTVNALSQLSVVQCAQRTYGVARSNSVLGCGLYCMEAGVRVITFPAALLLRMCDAPFLLADRALYNGVRILRSSPCAPRRQVCCGETPCTCLIPIVYRGEDTEMDPEPKP